MTKFHELPESVECAKMKEYFEEYLLYYCNDTSSENVNYALSELLELADRQWHTYQLLEGRVKEKVERYLKTVIDFEDAEIMDYILCIIPRMGLSNLFSYILQNKDSIQNREILLNITESENEYGEDVDNPYSGLRQ